MAQIKELNRDAVKAVSDDLKKLLQTFAQEKGLSLDWKGGSFSPSSFRPSFELCAPEAKNDEEREKFEYNCQYVLREGDPAWYGRQLVWKGKRYQLFKIEPRANQPFYAKEVGGVGAGFRCSAAYVKANLLPLEA
jgi:hypothetical protein